MACLIKHDVVNTPFMCIPQGLSIMNYQELMELKIQTEKKKKLLVMLKAADLVPAVCSWTIFKSPLLKASPQNNLILHVTSKHYVHLGTN